MGQAKRIAGTNKGLEMSLFEDDRFEYRETCFVLFPKEHRPAAKQLVDALKSLGDRYVLSNPEVSTEGSFDALTVHCPDDRAAIDISYLEGDDVREHVDELLEDFHQVTLSNADRTKLDKLRKFDGRLDLFHFEERCESEDDDGGFDPGALLVILERLAKLTGGVGVDPQSLTLL